ncbi:hypothetical protein [Novosphingobium sp. AP12]|uniref:hypothetical protein n=1 Tax=Novosphingobium sp. AP12 TaxID=1144305 RepID=UPI000271D8B7|nr:hypothetical protein [Novosphingobium sp. AP12]EJL29497.1 hypothetical protein PMI02_02211 [Novosphingobium sp. AP12]
MAHTSDPSEFDPGQPPIGVHIVHQYYPGFIDVLPNTLYLVDGAGLRGAVHVVGHVRPLVVTDFANGLTRFEGEGGAVYTRLERPIGDVDDASNVVDAKGLEGRSAPTIAIEKGRAGRIFYQDVFTELQTLTEITTPNSSAGLIAHGQLVGRFVAAYRFVHKDPRLEMPSAVPIETTPLRVGYYLYSPQERALPFDKRIARAWPNELHLSIAALGRGVRSLRDHDVAPELLEKRSFDLNAHLCNGFALSENLLELERLVDLAFTGGRRRAAIVEAVSLFEVGLLQARDRLPAGERAKSSGSRASEDLTLKMLVNRVLPHLLRQFDGEPGPLIKRANEMRSIRNSVVHQRHEPSLDEVNHVLSVVHTILVILELRDKFKGNWKRKSSP